MISFYQLAISFFCSFVCPLILSLNICLLILELFSLLLCPHQSLHYLTHRQKFILNIVQLSYDFDSLINHPLLSLLHAKNTFKFMFTSSGNSSVYLLNSSTHYSTQSFITSVLIWQIFLISPRPAFGPFNPLISSLPLIVLTPRSFSWYIS